MQFFSTRDQNRKVTSSQAIAQGLSDEGGLFVPESFPQVDVKALCGLDYPALAAAVVREYLTDYDPAFLPEATRSFDSYRMVVYSLVLVLMMIFRPGGLLGSYDFSMNRIVEKIMNGELFQKKAKEGKDHE